MNYRYRVVEPFWTHFYRLTAAQKEATRQAWKIFKENPLRPALANAQNSQTVGALRADNLRGGHRGRFAFHILH
jgi:hypothetical protein